MGVVFVMVTCEKFRKRNFSKEFLSAMRTCAFHVFKIILMVFLHAFVYVSCQGLRPKLTESFLVTLVAETIALS